MRFSHKSKIRLKRSALAIIIISSLLLTGCDVLASRDPFHVSSGWICDNASIVLTHWRDDDGYGKQQCWLQWDGKQVDVEVGFRSNLFWVMLAGPRAPTEILFQGKWKYQGDKLIFMIEKDNIFDGAYKTLVFTKKE